MQHSNSSSVRSCRPCAAERPARGKRRRRGLHPPCMQHKSTPPSKSVPVGCWAMARDRNHGCACRDKARPGLGRRRAGSRATRICGRLCRAHGPRHAGNRNDSEQPTAFQVADAGARRAYTPAPGLPLLACRPSNIWGAARSARPCRISVRRPDSPRRPCPCPAHPLRLVHPASSIRREWPWTRRLTFPFNGEGE